MDELQERRGPGRPPKYVEVKGETTEPIGQHVRPARNRKPFGTLEQTMAYESRPGFHRHWFNDVKDRISRAQEAGYEHVKDNAGKNVQMVVGTAEGGGAMHAFLMEIPQDWYDEDMRAQQKLVDEREAQIKRGRSDRQAGDGRYVPAQGIRVFTGS